MRSDPTVHGSRYCRSHRRGDGDVTTVRHGSVRTGPFRRHVMRLQHSRDHTRPSDPAPRSLRSLEQPGFCVRVRLRGSADCVGLHRRQSTRTQRVGRRRQRIQAAGRIRRAPRRTDRRGTVVGTFRISDRTITEYSCTNDSLRIQRNARHGEGAYVGHVLLAWSANGIDYAVSARGHTQANLALVKRLASSITFTAPTESREEAASASLRSVVGSGLLSAIDLVVKARGTEYQRLTGSRSSSARPGESR